MTRLIAQLLYFNLVTVILLLLVASIVEGTLAR